MITTFTAKIDISTERIQDLLVTAFEGGSNHWYTDLQIVEDCGSTKYDRTGVHRFHIVPTCGGSVSLCAEDDDAVHVLDAAAIQRGINVMALDHTAALFDFLGENEDAETADVFLQCCLFGEVIFG